MLAAGIGRRLEDPTLPPKVLLRFGGRTLLDRHVEILRHCGIEDVTGLPWVEIDFSEDLARARSEVFPALLDLPSGDSAPGSLRRAGE